MILWSTQPFEVYDQIQKTGVYHCDFEKSLLKDYRLQYDWLVQEMKNRLGEPHAGVTYPVWAWYKWEGIRMEPHLTGRPDFGYRRRGRETGAEYAALPAEKKKEYKAENWKRAFNLNYLNNGWTLRGDSIQATFWELRKEDVRKVRFFRAARAKKQECAN